MSAPINVSDYSHHMHGSNVSLAPNTKVTQPSSQCLLLQVGDLAPWDNPDSVVSAHTESVVRWIKEILVLPLLFLIGAPANIINMAVFAKQGLKERINVCLFALSLADFLILVSSMLLYGEQIYLQFTTKERYGPIMRFLTNRNLLGLHGFLWVSQVASAIIASERCFCILQPLRSQTVLSTSTTVGIIVIDYLVVGGMFFLVASRYWMVCAYDPVTDIYIWTIVLSEFYYRHQAIVDFFGIVLYSAVLPLIVISVVMVTTIITAVKLRQAAVWRAGTSSSAGMSAPEMVLTKMLVCSSVLFIVCALPNVLFSLTRLSIPEINPGKSQYNFYLTWAWIIDMLSYVNSAFNIVIYYIMGSRYRQTFWNLLGRKTQASKGTTQDLSSSTAVVTTNNVHI